MPSIFDILEKAGDSYGEKIIVTSFATDPEKPCMKRAAEPSSSSEAKRPRSSSKGVTFKNNKSRLWQASLVNMWSLDGREYPTASSTARVDVATGGFVNVDGLFCYKFHANYSREYLEKCTRMIGFDLDGCLIKPSRVKSSQSLSQQTGNSGACLRMTFDQS